ncbi:hypothetical protein ACA910_001733 [Epithemia clementina (nom. ined.)]
MGSANEQHAFNDAKTFTNKTFTNKTDDDAFLGLLENASSVEIEGDVSIVEEAASQVLKEVNGALFPKNQNTDTQFRSATKAEDDQSDLNIDDLNIDLNREFVELLDSCYNGTFVELNALSLEPGWSMYRTLWYSFRVNARIDVTELLPTTDLPYAAILMFRFVLCDAIKTGFCNPFVKNPVDNNSTVIAMSPATPRSIVGMVDLASSTIFSPWVLPRNTQIVAETDELIVEDVEIQFTVPITTPIGLYRLVLHTMVVLETNDTYASTVRRLDTAAKADVPILKIQEEPQILEMTPSLRVFMFVLIAIYDAIVLMMLASLYKYRSHPAVQLAQGSFLAALLVAALVGGTFTFTFMPEEDWYCVAWGPLIIFPFTLMGAILVARLWRVYVTLSGAIQIGRNTRASNPDLLRRRSSMRITQIVDVGSWNLLDKVVGVLSFFAKLPLLTKCFGKTLDPQRHKSTFRRTATEVESTQLVIFLVLPQVLLQTIGNAAYTPSLELVMEDSNRIGRYFCTRNWDWVQMIGLFLAAMMYALATVMAWKGRELPSIFNEKDAIFNTATVAALFLLINIMVVEMIEDPASSPDTSAFFRCVTLLGIATLVIFNLVFPKIRRASKGEKIVVGKLLRAYGNVEEESGSAVVSSELSQKSSIIARAPIVLRRNEALPQSLEMQIHQLHGLLRMASEKCAYGRSLSTTEWEQMSRQVAKLKTSLDCVSLDWNEDDEPQGDAGTPNTNIFSRSPVESATDTRADCDSGDQVPDGQLSAPNEKETTE